MIIKPEIHLLSHIYLNIHVSYLTVKWFLTLSKQKTLQVFIVATICVQLTYIKHVKEFADFMEFILYRMVKTCLENIDMLS